MLTKKLLLAAAAVGALVWLQRRKASPKLTCPTGQTFKPDSLATTIYSSPAVRDSIAKYGGYCVKAGNVSLPTQGGAIPDDDPDAGFRRLIHLFDED